MTTDQQNILEAFESKINDLAGTIKMMLDSGNFNIDLLEPFIKGGANGRILGFTLFEKEYRTLLRN